MQIDPYSRDLNRETLRIHLLGVEHGLGIHAFSMPCPTECPRKEITLGEARDLAGHLLRGKPTLGPGVH